MTLEGFFFAWMIDRNICIQVALKEKWTFLAISRYPNPQCVYIYIFLFDTKPRIGKNYIHGILPGYHVVLNRNCLSFFNNGRVLLLHEPSWDDDGAVFCLPHRWTFVLHFDELSTFRRNGCPHMSHYINIIPATPCPRNCALIMP